MTIQISEDNKNIIDQIIPEIDRILITGHEILNYYTEEKYDLLSFIFINLLDRSISILESISILLPEYKNNSFLETPIGVILRSGVLDFIMNSYLTSLHINYLTSKNEENKKILDDAIDSILSDHIMSTFSSLSLYKEVSIINEDEYKTTINNVKNSYSDLFIKDCPINYDSPKKNLITNKRIRTDEMIRVIAKNKHLSNFKTSIDSYNQYSKYDHFGIMTNEMQTHDRNINLKNISQVLNTIILNIITCTHTLNLEKFKSQIELLVYYQNTYKSIIQNIKVKSPFDETL